MRAIALVDTSRDEYQILPFVAVRLHRCDDPQCDAVHGFSLCIGWMCYSLWITFDL